MTNIYKFKNNIMRLILLASIFNAVQIANAQEAGITLNWKDADIRIVVEAVSEATGKNFIIDPRVTGNVNLLSAEPMSTDAFYEAFDIKLGDEMYLAPEERVRIW